MNLFDLYDALLKTGSREEFILLLRKHRDDEKEKNELNYVDAPQKQTQYLTPSIHQQNKKI